MILLPMPGDLNQVGVEMNLLVVLDLDLTFSRGYDELHEVPATMEVEVESHIQTERTYRPFRMAKSQLVSRIYLHCLQSIQYCTKHV